MCGAVEELSTIRVSRSDIAMLRIFGKSIAIFSHPERSPIVETIDEIRIFLLLQYYAGFIPEKEWSEMLARDSMLLAMFNGAETVH